MKKLRYYKFYHVVAKDAHGMVCGRWKVAALSGSEAKEATINTVNEAWGYPDSVTFEVRQSAVAAITVVHDDAT